ncbi:hypothetical protein QE152_g28529 [Popillia japonica]|uniref:Uncharacterized protein n=1 Tax=Popillia japonica TaxID=7064 RepID=A0AAW1JJY2_POPJA
MSSACDRMSEGVNSPGYYGRSGILETHVRGQWYRVFVTLEDDYLSITLDETYENTTTLNGNSGRNVREHYDFERHPEQQHRNPERLERHPGRSRFRCQPEEDGAGRQIGQQRFGYLD